MVTYESILQNVVTKNKELPPEAVRDMLVSLITLKYTQQSGESVRALPEQRHHGLPDPHGYGHAAG